MLIRYNLLNSISYMNSPNSFSSRGKKFYITIASLITLNTTTLHVLFIYMCMQYFNLYQFTPLGQTQYVQYFTCYTISLIWPHVWPITYTSWERFNIMSFNYYVCYHKIGLNFQIIAPPPPSINELDKSLNFA